jgi:hypothetical protein
MHTGVGVIFDFIYNTAETAENTLLLSLMLNKAPLYADVWWSGCTAPRHFTFNIRLR